ncbi:MAG: CapA family protein, partial [Gemmatimonadaceae bacterium]
MPVAIGFIWACASPPLPPAAPPSPVPARPVPTTTTDREPARPRENPPVVARRDTAKATPSRASRDSAPERVARRVPPVRVRSVRPGARNDTLATSELSAPVRVCAGGDVTLGTNLDREWTREGSRKLRTEFNMGDRPEELILPLKPLVAEADVVLLNVESAVGSGATPSKCGRRSTNCYAFRAPASAAYAIRDVAPRKRVVGNVANNHSRDAGDAGRDTTVALLARAGVLVTGADTIATPVVTAPGDTIGVLGFYTSADAPDARDTAAVYRHVARAAAQYPVVIVTMHLGAEGAGAQRTRDATEIFLRIDRGNPVAFADAAVRGGAAMVIGHGPHVLRAMEWRERGALIAYSLGNLLTYGPFTLKEPLNRGAVLCATIDRNGRVSSASIRSTMQLAAGVLVADSTNRAAALVDSLSAIDFRGTNPRVDR